LFSLNLSETIHTPQNENSNSSHCEETQNSIANAAKAVELESPVAIPVTPKQSEHWSVVDEEGYPLEPLDLASKLNQHERENRQVTHLDLKDYYEVMQLQVLAEAMQDLNISGLKIKFPLGT
jgi:hypothetical protein